MERLDHLPDGSVSGYLEHACPVAIGEPSHFTLQASHGFLSWRDTLLPQRSLDTPYCRLREPHRADSL